MHTYLTQILLCLVWLLVNRFPYMHTLQVKETIYYLGRCSIIQYTFGTSITFSHDDILCRIPYICQGLALIYYIINSFVMRFCMIACDIETKEKQHRCIQIDKRM
jgi:hypothetical protein